MMFDFLPLLSFFTLTCLSIRCSGYISTYHSPTLRPFSAIRRSFFFYHRPHFLTSSSEEHELEAGDVSFMPEQSQMYGFISDFLRQNSDNDNAYVVSSDNNVKSQPQHQQAQFLIAIPMDACVELGLELESVQRAVLYHCPVLVHACLPMAMTRLPLLYVSTNRDDSSSNANTLQAMQRLNRVVSDTVQRVIYNNKDGEYDDDEAAVTRSSTFSDYNERITTTKGMRDDDGHNEVNEEVAEPLLIPFQTLEIDGVGNQVLCTVGDPKSAGTRTLRRLVEELQQQISQRLVGWIAKLPEDPQNGSSSWSPDLLFRPRIPFMRLPRNWDDYLPKEYEFLTSDQGGNGISPILWGQWIDDQFGDAARMREIGIYKRRSRNHQEGEDAEDEETVFRVPDCVVPLPRGNATLSQAEKKFDMYQQGRMVQAQQRERELASAGSEYANRVNKEDRLFSRTLDRLESLYNQGEITLSSPSELLGGDERRSNEQENRSQDSWVGDRDLIADPGRPQNPDSVDDWTRERIRQVVDSRARVQTEKKLTTKSKTKPPIEENPVFAKYRDGTLVPEQDEPEPPPELPPFPSREYCVGFWRVVKSPTGFEVEEGDSSRSDNLILRVDGTTAGGPILDQETRQKASAGTWRLQGDTPDSAQLRIRLVIPPQKERILVMKGKLERISMSSDLPLTRGTFGIPALEERFNRASAKVEDLLYCSGTVTMEDAITGKNKEEIGTFSLMKLNTPSDPSQYTITIPRPVRNQD